MSRTLSKQKNYKKNAISSLQKTEKKKPIHSEISLVTKSTVWMNKQKVSAFIQEGTNIDDRKDKNDVWQQLLCKKYLKITNPTHIKINRARIFDWLLDVCRAFQLRWESYWCAVQILDFLIFSVQFVKISNIHMTSVACLFIATKIHETEPPSIYRIIDKAVYNCFTQKDVIQLEGQIILYCANSSTQPKYLNTVYNSLYQNYPKMASKDRVQVLRRLVLIWMDPVSALKLQTKSEINYFSSQKFLISYDDLVKTVVQDLEKNTENSNFEQVRQFFSKKYQCQNLKPLWPGFDQIRF